MQNVFISGILKLKKLILLVVPHPEASVAEIKVRNGRRLEPFDAYLYLPLAEVTVDFPPLIKVVLTELVSKGEPSLSKVVVTGKQFYLVRCRHKQVDKSIDLVWFLTFFADFCND